MQLGCLVVLMCTHQHTQTANQCLLLHAEELELLPVLPALQRQRVLCDLHNRVLSQSRSLLVQEGVSLAQGRIAGQTGPYCHRWSLYAMVTVDGWEFGFPVWWCHLHLCWCRLVRGDVLYFSLKAGIYLQREVRGEEHLTLWTEERNLVGAVCFPHSPNAAETEVVPAWQRHRICEDVLAHGTLKRFLNCLHSSVCTCVAATSCFAPGLPAHECFTGLFRPAHNTHVLQCQITGEELTTSWTCSSHSLSEGHTNNARNVQKYNMSQAYFKYFIL